MSDVFPALPVEVHPLSGPDEAVLAHGPCFGLVSVRLEFAAGSVGEARAGSTALALEMLERGTLRRDRGGLRRALDALGARLGVRVGRNGSAVALRALEEVLPEALALLEEVLLEPADDAEELADAVAEMDEALEAERVEPGAVVGRLLGPALWPGLPWAAPSDGTRASRAG
ncbi:MAG: hypothetical protein EA398_18205, partial [Deltaproteobacteria bacterium]